ncbi:MAG TPA: hypothetical protein VF970_00225 [Gemmatimonadales bacterium]
MAIPIHEQQDAKETLAYIRRTMESASTFTAVSGWGLVAVGAVGLLAAGLAWSTRVPADLRVWIPAAVLSVAVAGGSTAGKARRLEAPLWSGSLRKIVWVMSPALLSGALLTYALLQANAAHLLPGTWLALYGAGVSAGGVFSVRALRWMGLNFVVLGAVALLVPATGLVLLALGFGGLHVAFGAYLARRHGG